MKGGWPFGSRYFTGVRRKSVSAKMNTGRAFAQQPTAKIVVIPLVQRRAVGTSVRAEQSLRPDMK